MAAKKTTALHDSMSTLEEEMWYINRQVPQGATESIAAYKASVASVDKKMKQATRDAKETERMLARAQADRQTALKVGLRSEIDALEGDYEAGASALALEATTEEAKDVEVPVEAAPSTVVANAVISDASEPEPSTVLAAPKAVTELSRVRGGIARRKLRAKERAEGGQAPAT
jgi:hypothetical protein